jgi:parallel beta-helix repeat protein
MCYFKLLLPTVLLVVSVSVLQATTIHVPADSTTIQAGINGAVDGDTVLVADGTYTGDGNRGIDFMGKAIVVMSENGAESCVIDCEGEGRGFSFYNEEDSGSILQGFTITQGWGGQMGGGIFCSGSSPTISDNTITNNGATLMGAGIYCIASSPTITGNTISGNTSSEGHGGGIFCEYDCYPTITGNTITGNTAVWVGGGFCCFSSSPTITGNTFSGNTAGDAGGGIFFRYYSTPTITGNTFTGNTAGNAGGGIFCHSSSMIITNTIFWDNDAQEGKELWIGVTEYPSIVTISYSDVEGGLAAVYIALGCTLNWLDGMIDGDPVFVLPDKKDYRLLWDSPCMDTGDPTLFDPDGTRSDMGAHFFNQDDYMTLYLTPDATEVLPGDELGVTYTAVNRWDSPEPFWLLSQVLLPGGSSLNVLGPSQYTLPANYTAQVHITHPVPNITPTGMYEYRSLMGMPPGTLYDSDSFKFTVIE